MNDADRIYEQSKHVKDQNELQKIKNRLNFLGAWDYAAEVDKRLPHCSCVHYAGDNPECRVHACAVERWD